MLTSIQAVRSIPFGIPALDHAAPLLLGSLHEVAGAGPDTEHGAAAALFLAGVLARLEGPVLWVQEGRICSPPASPAWACTRPA